MPTKTRARKRAELVRVRTKRLPDGTILRVHVYGKPGTPSPRKGK